MCCFDAVFGYTVVTIRQLENESPASGLPGFISKDTRQSIIIARGIEYGMSKRSSVSCANEEARFDRVWDMCIEKRVYSFQKRYRSTSKVGLIYVVQELQLRVHICGVRLRCSDWLDDARNWRSAIGVAPTWASMRDLPIASHLFAYTYLFPSQELRIFRDSYCASYLTFRSLCPTGPIKLVFVVVKYRTKPSCLFQKHLCSKQ